MRFLLGLVFLLIVGCCGAILPLRAQGVSDSLSHETYSLYYIQDHINIDEDYLDNAYQISRIRDILARSPQIDSIAVYAYASPEGSYSRNVWLAEKRAEAAKQFIIANMPSNSSLQPENIHLCPMGENWHGLLSELEENYHRPNRDMVMRIMYSRVHTETKKRQLRQLDNGFTYNLIIREHMPRLRVATWICVYIPMEDMITISIKDLTSADAQLIMPQLPAFEPIEFPTEVQRRKTILALKTNLLYDAFSLLNYSVEVPFSEHFSALIYHQFPWWRWGEANNEYCIRFLSVGTEARWWFKPMLRPRTDKRRERDRLMGHFVGVYAESGKWDFEWKRSICYQGEHWSVGLIYGYSMPVGKYLNLEFSLSAGYASIPYRKYDPSEDYEILLRDPVKQGRWNYFGPTKAQVSLVLPIMVKSQKGGGR